MKKSLLLFSLASLMVSCGGNTSREESKTRILHGDMPLCESVLVHDGKIIVTCFGDPDLELLNTEGKGYVLRFTDTVAKVLIPADGTLSAPKGTIVRANSLFIADVNKIVVYNLKDLSEAPQLIVFPAGELMVNDFAIRENMLYTTVTNTGDIFSLDITDPARIDPATLQFYTNITGCNGIRIRGNTMYVASYPFDLVTTEENVIYVIDDMEHPSIAKLIERPGLYDGLALSPDGSKLYFSEWGETTGNVGYVDLKSAEVKLLDLGVELAGPARIWLDGGKLYIPDMPLSRIMIYTLPE